MTGSRVMETLLNWWIFSICKVASGRGYRYSLPSRLVFVLYWEKYFCVIFFKAGSKQVLVRIIGWPKKNNTLHLSFLAKVYTLNINGQEPKKLIGLFINIFFFSSWFHEILSGMPSQSKLVYMWIKIKFHLVIKCVKII